MAKEDLGGLLDRFLAHNQRLEIQYGIFVEIIPLIWQFSKNNTFLPDASLFHDHSEKDRNLRLATEDRRFCENNRVRFHFSSK